MIVISLPDRVMVEGSRHASQSRRCHPSVMSTEIRSCAWTEVKRQIVTAHANFIVIRSVGRTVADEHTCAMGARKAARSGGILFWKENDANPVPVVHEKGPGMVPETFSPAYRPKHEAGPGDRKQSRNFVLSGLGLLGYDVGESLP